MNEYIKLKDSIISIIENLKSREISLDKLMKDFAEKEQYWKAEAMRAKKNEVSSIIKILKSSIE